MNPLAQTWKHKARAYRVGVSHLGGEAPVVAWQRRAIVPYFAGPGAADIAELVEPDGRTLRTIDSPKPHTNYRAAVGPAIVWPEESLVFGIETETLALMWIDFDGGMEITPTELTVASRTTQQRAFAITSTADGNVLVSAATEIVMPTAQDLAWPLPRQLDPIYHKVRSWPFEELDFKMQSYSRTGKRWDAPGRVACVADDVVLLDEKTHLEKTIVARKTADGTELWRMPAADRFVLGTNAMPAWSDDRVYIYDRNARRLEAWRREVDAAQANNFGQGSPLQTVAAIRLLTAFRAGAPLMLPTTLRCISTRTGETLWHIDVADDIVSFFVHPRYVAIVTTRHVLTYRHDGTPIASRDTTSTDGADPTMWPPDPSRWPCIVHGDNEHLVLAQNRAKRDGGGRMYCARVDDLEPTWETPLPANCVVTPLFRWLRLLSYVPIAFTGDAAVLRWGKQLYGFTGVGGPR